MTGPVPAPLSISSMSVPQLPFHTDVLSLLLFHKGLWTLPSRPLPMLFYLPGISLPSLFYSWCCTVNAHFALLARIGPLRLYFRYHSLFRAFAVDSTRSSKLEVLPVCSRSVLCINSSTCYHAVLKLSVILSVSSTRLQTS